MPYLARLTFAIVYSFLSLTIFNFMTYRISPITHNIIISKTQYTGVQQLVKIKTLFLEIILAVLIQNINISDITSEGRYMPLNMHF